MKATMTDAGRALGVALGVALGLALGGLTACSKPPAKASAGRAESESGATRGEDPATGSQAEKTRELEDKAADYKDRFQEIQGSDMSADDKAKAASELVDEQQKTVHEAEDGPAAEEGAEPQQ